jgi:hypothetical protein
MYINVKDEYRDGSVFYVYYFHCVLSPSFFCKVRLVNVAVSHLVSW